MIMMSLCDQFTFCFCLRYLEDDGEYALERKECMNSEYPFGCEETCQLDTSGTSPLINCCCTGYLCNEYSQLEFTDVRRVSMYGESFLLCSVLSSSVSCLCMLFIARSLSTLKNLIRTTFTTVPTTQSLDKGLCLSVVRFADHQGQLSPAGFICVKG